MAKKSSFSIDQMRNSFSREEMEKLFEGCPTIHLKKGGIIYVPDEILSDVFWLSDGMAEVSIMNNEGKKLVLAFHFPDSIMGEIESFYGDPCELTCIAIKNNTVVHKCNVETFFERVQKNGLMRRYVSMLATKTHSNVLQISSVALDDCEARVKAYYNSGLTHQQMAELLGCSRVQVTRVLNNQHRQGQKKEPDAD